MSHVDEGTLHAYLDGELEGIQPGATASLEAHLAGCEQCRARLDEARGVRERASRILEEAGSTPVEVPPFDVVLRRARVARSVAGASRPRRRQPLLPLAWAASVALALLGGWMARGMDMRTPPATVRFEATAAEAGDIAAQPQAAAPPATAGPGAPAVAARTSPAVPAQPSPTQRATGAGETIAEAPVADRAAPAEAEPQPAAGAARTLVPERAEALGAARAAAVAADARPGEAPRTVGGADVVVAATPAAADAAVTGPWTPVDRAEAERRLGGRLILVEGLEVASIEAADSAGGPRVRVRQPLAAGVFLELVQQRAAAAKPAEAGGRAGVSAAPRRDAPVDRMTDPAAEVFAVERDGFTVTLRAVLSPDSLRALAGRLR